MKAALLHHGKLVTKKQDEYVKSKRHDPFIPNDWTAAMFNNIDWQSVRASTKCLSDGQRFQIAKFAHNWTPTLDQRAIQDNSIDQRCFTCGAWRKTIDHVLHCKSGFPPSNQTWYHAFLLDPTNPISNCTS
jgi:hypothetical protein